MRNYKASLLIILIYFIFTGYINADQDIKEQVLERYLEYSPLTDPGEYVHLYKDLPESLNELCGLIKKQLIHPVDVRQFADVIPPENYFEDPKFPTVEKMLEGLIARNPDGLTLDRRPEHRLVVACQNHSLLLASILKSRGVPTRLRYGFAPYLARGGDLHVYHIICEVWNKEENRWTLVDPDRKMVDFPREQFELARDVWLQFQNGEIDSQKYGVAEWWGDYMILDVLCHDFLALLSREISYMESPPISTGENIDVSKIEKDKVEVLDKISSLINNPGENMDELISIHNQYQFLQYEK